MAITSQTKETLDTLQNELCALNNIPFIVPFDPATDKLYPFNFTISNKELSQELIKDTNSFTGYIDNKLKAANCRYGIGGYAEDRILYARSTHFDADDEPRRLHLGVDIWGSAATPVYAPLRGTVHSFHFNNNFGDYGATIILTHILNGIQFHTLYGHLDLQSISNLNDGQEIEQGQQIARFGISAENGNWPPHLHFQIIQNMEGKKGDYPGVCRSSERQKYLGNCPDPELILRAESYYLQDDL